MNNAIVISDLHCGDRLGLCPPHRVKLTDGGYYVPSALQRQIYRWWKEFWGEWVPEVTRRQGFSLIVNGDSLEGVHHGSTTTISNDMNDQVSVLRSVLEPVVNKHYVKRVYWIKGTDAHVGINGTHESRVAELLGAIPDQEGSYARPELWIQVGRGLCHLLHHIGSTGSAAYEATAVGKELVEAYAEAGRNRRRPPDLVCRSHRHRNFEVRLPTELGYGISMITAGWQGKTPYCYRMSMARQSTPQFGGSLIRQGDHDFYTRHFTKSLPRQRLVVV